MSHRSRGFLGADLADRMTPAIKWLLIANGLIYLLQMLISSVFHQPLLELWFGLVPDQVFAAGRVWQLVTYMFLHGGLFHLLFNMLVLWMFGVDIEREWGTAEFLRYYFFCGVGAGLTNWVMSIHSPAITIGASGAIFGVLLAFGMLFPDRPVLLYFILPIPAKYLVILFGFIEVVAVAGGNQGGIARFAHLGGLLFGFLYLKGERYTYPLRRSWGTFRRKQAAENAEAEARRRDAERERIDAILEKISRQGMGSLSPQERKILEEAGRRGRGERH